MVTWRFRVPLLSVRFRLPHPLEVIGLSWPLLRRLLCVLLTVSLLSLFSFPANAELISGTTSVSARCYGTYGGSTSWYAFGSTALTGTSGTLAQNSSGVKPAPNRLAINQVVHGGLLEAFGSLTLSVSFYCRATVRSSGSSSSPESYISWSYGSNWDKPAGYRSFYRDESNVEHAGTDVDVRSFTANGKMSSRGITIQTGSYADEVNPLMSIGFASLGSAGVAFIPGSTNSKVVYNAAELVFTSVRMVATASSGDTEALKDIADAIVEGNQILSAMYGDILAVCNQIYQRTGSILETQRLANTYLIAIRDYLQSLNTTTEAIYSLLGAKFDLLISTIQTESDDIQAAIDKAVQDMIAYLDAAFSGAVGQLPSVGDSLQDQSDALENQESQWMGSMTDNFESLQMGNFAFPVGIISGFGLITSIFSQLWDKLGVYAAIYTFPLFLGIALLLIGRMSKFAGRSSSRKDGE